MKNGHLSQDMLHILVLFFYLLENVYIYGPNVGPMLVQRRRWWTYIGTMSRVCWDPITVIIK